MRKITRTLMLIAGTLLCLNNLTQAQIQLTEYTTGSPYTNFISVAMASDGVAYVGSTALPASNPACMNLMKTTDNGDSWSYASSCAITPWPDPYTLITELVFIDAQHGFALADQGFGGYYDPKILETTDGGTNWTIRYTYPRQSGIDNLNDLQFFTNTAGLAIGRKNGMTEGTVIRTTDGGATWGEDFNSFNNLQLLDLEIVDNSIAYLAAQDGNWLDTNIHWYLYKTVDQGGSWSLVYSDTVPYTNDLDSKVSKLEFINELEGWMAYSGFSSKHSHLYHTTDGGLNWVEVAVPLNESMDFNDLLFLNSNEGFLVAGNWCSATACYRGNALLHTTDGGANWSVLKHDPYDPYALYAMDYNGSVGYVVGGTIDIDGGRVFKLENMAVGIKEDQKLHVELFPNPADEQFTIRSDRYPYEYRIHDLTGRELAQGTVQDSEHSVALKELSKGMYYITFEKDNASTSQKLLID